MPKIYLSPSTQEFNEFITGGSEEYYMNLIADALEPYLRSNGIDFTRNRPDMTAAQSIRESNAGQYNFHLALHSNAAPDGESGTRTGVEVYYYPYSQSGEKMAEIMAANFRNIYPDPNRVITVPTTSLGEVDRTKAPSVLLEIGYHDNPSDANWIKDNIDLIAKTIAQSLTEYFALPFIAPTIPRRALVTTTFGNLNIRSRPGPVAPIVQTAPKDAKLTVFGETDNQWYTVEYDGVIGFAYAKYITMLDR